MDFSQLSMLAGRSAFRQIRENGLHPEDIAVVMGASGAAKWLAISGLDKAVFSNWLKHRSEPLALFGTSIGAWKFAAAAQQDCGGAFDRLKQAYTHQVYRGRVTAAKVTQESVRILNQLLPDGAVEQILGHPYLRIAFSAVRCKGLMKKNRSSALFTGMAAAFGFNLLSRRSQKLFFNRTLFHDPRENLSRVDMGDFPPTRVTLTPENFRPALMASGAIPLIMEGVDHIAGAPRGVYRDGGILDYHPAFPLARGHKGLILYPHFYPDLTLGWFDKKLSQRRAGGDLLDHTLILSPSAAFVAKLPFAKIPDRNDFIRFKDQDRVRIEYWQTAGALSAGLGEAFIEAVESGRIKDLVRRIPPN